MNHDLSFDSHDNGRINAKFTCFNTAVNIAVNCTA